MGQRPGAKARGKDKRQRPGAETRLSSSVFIVFGYCLIYLCAELGLVILRLGFLFLLTLYFIL
jgi:hypothetical protein